MDRKLKMMIVLGYCFIALPNGIFATNVTDNVIVDSNCVYNSHKRGHKQKVNIRIKYHEKRQRSILSANAYIEENSLYLYFSSPLENVSLEITNENTGTLIFSGEFTGTSLVIPIQEDGYEFEIDINN